ncbi:MAG: hypothetical protein RL169_939 [Armatimonadota bacterium]
MTIKECRIDAVCVPSQSKYRLTKPGLNVDVFRWLKPAVIKRHALFRYDDDVRWTLYLRQTQALGCAICHIGPWLSICTIWFLPAIRWTNQKCFVIGGVREDLIPPAVGCISTEWRTGIYTTSVHIVTKEENRVIVVTEVHLQTKAELAHIRHAAGCSRLLTRLCKHGEKDGCENRDDGNNDEELDKRKGTTLH